MKTNQKKELRTKTVEELVKDLRDLRSEVTKLAINMKTGKAENLSALRNKRKDIARILTFLTEKKSESV